MTVTHLSRLICTIINLHLQVADGIRWPGKPNGGIASRDQPGIPPFSYPGKWSKPVANASLRYDKSILLDDYSSCLKCIEKGEVRGISVMLPGVQQ